MMKGRTAILVFWLVSVGLAWGAEQKPRLGIVGGGESGGLADLLTVELSRSADVILVERGEIQKVLGELSLSAERSAGDYLKLGRILKADGLLILDSVEIEGKKAVSARLVAVNPGVVLGSAHSPLPIPDPEAWSKLIAKRFRPLFPKLLVPAGDGIPLSILNLYSSVDTPAGRELERELSILLAHRLTCEKDIFVLERWRMDRLAWEKDLELEKDNPFWTGSYLLDGRIDGETAFGTEAEMNVLLRLRLPRDHGQIDIQAAGKKNDLPALVNDLAMRVMGALNKTSVIPEWDAGAEAEQYFQEAQWASAHNLPEIARNASENAWALGYRTDELARLRISSYCHGNDLDSAIRAMELFLQYLKNIPPLAGTRLDPKHERFWKAPAWGQYTGLERRSTGTCEREAWLDLLNPVMEHASVVLKRHHDENPAAGREEQLRELRALLRSAADGLASRGETGIDAFKCRFAPYWYETPEQTLEAYRSVAGWLGLRDTMCDFPWLIWRDPADAGRLDALTKDFISELCASAKPEERTSGMMLTYLFLADKKQNLDGFADMLWSERECIVNGGMPKWQTEAFARISGWLKRNEFRDYWLNFIKYFFGENRNLALFLSMQSPLEFLAWHMETYHHAESAGEIYRCFLQYVQQQARRRPLTAAQTIELFRYETSLLAKYPRLRMAPPDGRLAMDGWSAAEIQQVRDLFLVYQRAVAPELSDENRAELQRQEEWFHVRLAAKTVPVEPLRVTRFCHLPVDQINSMIWAHRKLWVLWFSQGIVPTLIEVAPETFQTKTIRGPKHDFTKPGYGIGKTKLMEFSGGLVCLRIGRLLAYDLADRQWRELKLPPYNYTSAAVIDDRLCLGFARPSKVSWRVNDNSGILRMDLRGGAIEVLASSRRRPALTILDDMPPYGHVEFFFKGFGNRLAVCLCPANFLDGSFYSYDEAGKDWRYEGDRGFKRIMHTAPFAGGVLIYSEDRQYFAARPAEKKLQLLLGRVTPDYAAPGPARWERPLEFDDPVLSTCSNDGQNSAAFDGEHLWIFRHTRFGPRWWLWYFDGRTGRTTPIPLEFRLPPAEAPALTPGRARIEACFPPPEKEVGDTPSQYLFMAHTPFGVALSTRYAPGFWFLPLKDIEEYVARKSQSVSSKLNGKETNVTPASVCTPIGAPELRSDRQAESSAKARDGMRTNGSQPTKISAERNARAASRSSEHPNQTDDAKRGVAPFSFRAVYGVSTWMPKMGSVKTIWVQFSTIQNASDGELEFTVKLPAQSEGRIFDFRPSGKHHAFCMGPGAIKISEDGKEATLRFSLIGTGFPTIHIIMSQTTPDIEIGGNHLPEPRWLKDVVPSERKLATMESIGL